ncbi:MAG: DegT/DnrJ/EryC1/StrS family aminotransferase [Candidatus Pacearchaeota archaeon]
MIPPSKPYVSEEDISFVKKQVESGLHSYGEKVREFESLMSDYIGKKYAKATSSGTTALHIALLSLGVGSITNEGEKDEVILPSYICASVMSAVKMTGAIPVLADIQDDFIERGCNIYADKIKKLITKNTRAIIIPHMFGISADMDRIRKVSKNIPIIEDCAHSLGTKYKGKYVGSFGDISIFSFYATKVISSGQGGMILTSNKKLKDKIDDLTKYDQREEYDISYNYSMSDIHAALGISQLKQLEKFIKRRHEIADKYNKSLININKDNNFAIMKKIPEGSFPFKYLIMLKSKEEKETLRKRLKEKGVSASEPVFNPLHRYLKLNKDDFKNTEKAHDCLLSIPLYPALTNDEVSYVSETLKSFLG